MIDPIENIPTQPIGTGFRYTEECRPEGWVVMMTRLPESSGYPDVIEQSRDLNKARRQAKETFEKKFPGHTVLISGLR